MFWLYFSLTKPTNNTSSHWYFWSWDWDIRVPRGENLGASLNPVGWECSLWPCRMWWSKNELSNPEWCWRLWQWPHILSVVIFQALYQAFGLYYVISISLWTYDVVLLLCLFCRFKKLLWEGTLLAPRVYIVVTHQDSRWLGILN